MDEKIEAIREFYKNLEDVFSSDEWIEMNAFGQIDLALYKTLQTYCLDVSPEHK